MYDVNDKGAAVMLAQESTSSALNTVAIEPKFGNLLLCGGIDTKLSLYDINRERSKKESAKLIRPNKEFAGHRSLITSCGFLSPEYYISGSRDSSINLWELE